MARPRGRQKGRFSRTGPARRARRWNPASGQDAMTRTEMLETMKRLDAHANALLLTGASDIDLLGGMFDVMPDFKALLDAGYGGEIAKNAGRDRKIVVSGRRVSVRADAGGRRII